MSLSDDLNWRGLIKDKTFDDIQWLDQPRKFYLGIDASSDSLTIGNLAVTMLARRLLEAGWQAVLLAGGATSLVGDPGGKDEERELKSREEISKNIEGVKTQLERLFAGRPHELVNNLDWLDRLKLLDFLRDTGKQFPMAELMQREFVDARLGEGAAGISYAEFSYSLLQGYDFWHLFTNNAVEMQIGASDQWGNMLSGVALIRKKEAKEANAFSMPLVVDKATGRKFGKSEAGAIWLDPAKTSLTQFYQFWINTTDEEVEGFLKIFTLLPKEEIERLMAEHRADPSKRLAQTALAKEVSGIVHPSTETVRQTSQTATASITTTAELVTKYITGQANIVEASEAELEEIKKELPSTKARDVGSIVDALVQTGLATSNTMARTILVNGGIYINGQQIKRDTFEPNDFQNRRLLLRRGKAYRDSALIELE